MHVLVTGSAGLIGSAAVEYFGGLGARVDGVDNNMRADFFGPRGDTTWNRRRLEAEVPTYRHIELDIRDRDAVLGLFESEDYDVVIHAAAQPSHDLAASRPFDDFDTNAGGTLALLEATRRHAPEAVFALMSTNKVYGDHPNRLPLVESDLRYDFDTDGELPVGLTAEGITEELPVDGGLHSLFGVSKLSADVLAQEYGRNFGMKTGIFRGGCLTGPSHSGVELHGFLNYLVAVAVAEGDYTIFGYKGKQVRDQIHSTDVMRAIAAFVEAPRPGEAYNIGGGRSRSASVLECLDEIERRCGRRPRVTYSDVARRGDHICYYTDMSKFEAHYPDWRPAYDLDAILDEMVEQALRNQR